MRSESSSRSTIRITLAVLLFCAAGLILWRNVLGRHVGPDPVVPPESTQVDPMVMEAIEAAIDSIDSNKRDLSRRERLCMIYQANGLLKLAGDCWTQVVTMDAGAARAWFLLARTHERSGRMEEAVETMGRVIPLAPDQAAPHWQMALWLVDLGRLEEADSAVQHAIEIAADQEASWFALARLQLARHKYEEVVETIEVHSLVAGANGPHARHLLAAAYRGLGRGSEAQSLIGGAEDRMASYQDPWTSEMRRHRTGYSHMAAMSTRLIQAGRHQEALEILDRLHGMDPADHRISVLQAQCWLGLGQPEKGLQILQQAVEVTPDNHLLYTNLSLAALVAARSDESLVSTALEAAERAVELSPENSQARSALAGALLAAQRYDESAAEYRRSFELDARDPEKVIRAAFTLIGREQWSQGRELLEMVAAAEPQRASVWAGLAKIELETGSPSQAMSLFERATAASVQDAGDLSVLEAALVPTEPQ